MFRSMNNIVRRRKVQDLIERKKYLTRKIGLHLQNEFKISRNEKHADVC